MKYISSKLPNFSIQTTDLALPLRWTALEALTTSRFSIETDVWSMGVLIWEILSRAQRPYDELRSNSTLKLPSAVFDLFR